MSKIPSIGRARVLRWQKFWDAESSVFCFRNPPMRATSNDRCVQCDELIHVGAWCAVFWSGMYGRTVATHLGCVKRRGTVQRVLGEELRTRWTPMGKDAAKWCTLAEFYATHPNLCENFALVMHAYTDHVLHLRVDDTRTNLVLFVPNPRRFTESYLPRLVVHYAGVALRNL